MSGANASQSKHIGTSYVFPLKEWDSYSDLIQIYASNPTKKNHVRYYSGCTDVATYPHVSTKY